MSIYKYKQSQNWWIKYKDPSGKYRYVATGSPDRAKAEAIQATLNMAKARTSPAEILHALIDSLYGIDAKKQLPLSAALETYKAYLHTTRKAASARTMENRQVAFRRFLRWAEEHYPAATTPGKVDRACAVGFAQRLQKDGLADKSRQNILSDLSTLWEGLMRCTDGVTANPWKLVRPEVRDSEPGKPFSAAQVAAVLKAADDIGHGWGVACRVALYTGLRFGDVATLEWSDIDMDNAIIKVRPQKTARHKVDVLMPIAQPLLDALGALPRHCGMLLPEIGHRYPRQLKLWPFRKVLEKAKADAKLDIDTEAYTFHSFRHTFRTRLGEAGVASDIAKRLGGWTNDKMADRYDHSERIEELRAAVSKI
jgi:integrase